MVNAKEQAEVPVEYSFNHVLNLLAEQKWRSPQLFLAALSLTNLLGIISYLNNVESPSIATGSVRSESDMQALVSTMLSLLATDGGPGDKKEALLSGLINTLGGGGKKLDPSAILSLASSLAGQMDKTSAAAPAQYATDSPGTTKSQSVEIRELNAHRG
ncbi:MAG: hypothetical protein GX489_02760 [Firmicutes bacterium]|nr:hypothetical protein [Bacillota bacterium]